MDPITLGGYILAALIGLFGYKSRSGHLWKEEAEAERARADRLEKGLEELAQRVGRLEKENADLRELATSRAAVDSLTKTVAANHAEVMLALASQGTTVIKA